MTGYLAIRDASQQLRDLLWSSFEDDAYVVQFVPSPEAIVYASPPEAMRDKKFRLSLWLFRLSLNEFMRNAPQDASLDASQAVAQLPLNLHYLVTALTPSLEGDLVVLGRTLQALAERPMLQLHNSEDEVFGELRIVQGDLNNQDISHIWGALQQPYRLSLYYRVRVAQIDIAQPVPEGRVIERQFGPAEEARDAIR